jgi:hypothetical protein
VQWQARHRLNRACTPSAQRNIRNLAEETVLERSIPIAVEVVTSHSDSKTGHRSVQMVRRYIRDGSLFRENSAGTVVCGSGRISPPLLCCQCPVWLDWWPYRDGTFGTEISVLTLAIRAAKRDRWVYPVQTRGAYRFQAQTRGMACEQCSLEVNVCAAQLSRCGD